MEAKPLVLFFSSSLKKLDEALIRVNEVACYLMEADSQLGHNGNLSEEEKRSLEKQLMDLREKNREVMKNAGKLNIFITKMKNERR